MNRVIRKAQAHSSGEAFSLLAALMATELLQPSKCLWLISPWISDLILLDNSAGTYDALRRWGTRPVRLAEILATLLSSSATVVIATTPDPNNRRFRGPTSQPGEGCPPRRPTLGLRRREQHAAHQVHRR